VNSPPLPPDNDRGSLTISASIFDRFKKQSPVTRDFKPHFSLWGGTGLFADPSVNAAITNPANVHNLLATANDHVDIAGASNDFPLGAANGYIFPKPANTRQGFKTFGIRFGKFGHLYGTGAFYSHREYPYEAK
jgi:hypothetical protein